MRKQYGFTLVELIVAVAILSITAAITTPALTGYLDKGSEQKAVAEAHACVAAAESLATQRLMEGTLEGWADWDGSPPDADLTGFRHEGQGYYVRTGGGRQPAGVGACAEVTGQAQTPGTVTQLWCNGDGAVARLVYVTEGCTVVYARAMTKTGVWEPVPTPEPAPVPIPEPTAPGGDDPATMDFVITGPYASVTITAKPWPTGEGSRDLEAGGFYYQDGRLYFIYSKITWSQQQPPTSEWYTNQVMEVSPHSNTLYTESTIGRPNAQYGDMNSIGPINGRDLFAYNDKRALYVRGYRADYGLEPEQDPGNWVKVTSPYFIELSLP